MIRQEVGNDSLFFHTLSGFLAKVQEQQCIGHDFKNHLEEITAHDFDPFFDQWYFGEGYPIHQHQLESGRTIPFISIHCKPLHQQSHLFSMFSWNSKSAITTGIPLLPCRQTGNYNTWQFIFRAAISSVEADPHHWLLIKLAGSHNINTGESGNQVQNRTQSGQGKGEYLFYTALSEITRFTWPIHRDKYSRIRKSAQEHEVIDIQNYPPGMYFIIIKDKNAFTRVKFIIILEIINEPACYENIGIDIADSPGC